MSSSASPCPIHLLSNIDVDSLDLEPLQEREETFPRQPGREEMQVDELARAKGSVLQSKSITPAITSLIISQSALESRDAEIQPADLSSMRSSLSSTRNVFDHAHSYQGHRPVSTTTEHKDMSAISI